MAAARRFAVSGERIGGCNYHVTMLDEQIFRKCGGLMLRGNTHYKNRSAQTVKSRALRLSNNMSNNITLPDIPIKPFAAAIVPAPGGRNGWALRIGEAWQTGVIAIITTGQLLTEAKAALPHGEFLQMIKSDLPFKPSTAQRLMKIAHDPRLVNAAQWAVLPPHWRTLYELTKLDDASFEARLRDGTIRADMERRDIQCVLQREGRAERELQWAGKVLALPDKRYGVICADPAWRLEKWSRETGLDAAADAHYVTTPLAEIMTIDVPSIAADNSVLFLWATQPILPQALEVMQAWGFKYLSHCMWRKTDASPGTGHWFRNAHETLLVGTRGDVPCPAPGDQWPSVIEAPRGDHSAKPEVFLEMIESYFPNVPKIELNRRGPPRPGWDAWGFEALPVAAE
jgi:N6-adenosine-specific RNA methylase IME4